MKGVMVLGLLLPGAVLGEQLIKTTAGRLSITTGALAEQEWLESRGLEPVALSSRLPMRLARRDSSSLDCTTVCTTYIHTHTD